MNASEWKNKGGFIKVNGFEHFIYDSKTDRPVLLILHGYPTCSYDYYKVLPILENHFRVVVHDHLGFGYSDKPKNYSYSLMEQTDQALLIWYSLGIKNAYVLAHDYGTSIATELVARINRFEDIGVDIDALLLCNGSIHIELSQLRLIQKLLVNRLTGPIVARLSNQRIFANNLRNVYYDPKSLESFEIEALWQMMLHNNGRNVLPQVTQYISQRYRYWYRWIGALQQTKLPVKVIWAKDDPVAVLSIAHQLEQEIINSVLVELPELGHFPMLENPTIWANAVLGSVEINP